MNKIIGGFIVSCLTVILFTTVQLWKFTVLKDLFTLILAAVFVFVFGSFAIGGQIVEWLEENDTTRSNS